VRHDDNRRRHVLGEPMDPAAYRFTVHEYDGGPVSTLLKFIGSYAEAKEFARKFPSTCP
jgi:hypothetical protein